MKDHLKKNAIALLKNLIATPSISGKEQQTADIIEQFLKNSGVQVERKLNNVWARSKSFDPSLPTILLNSHHDTVKPVNGYSRDPYLPDIESGKLYGLGSNDAGGALVSLMAAFLYYYENAPGSFNLVFAATAEEEISGRNGIASIFPDLGEISLGIIGEPTQMQMAVAEKGLMVLDCQASGISGHAARDEGENAIYKALYDIDWIKNYQFPKVSELLGPVKLTVTQVKSGTQHNVIPDICEFVVDARINEYYTNRQVYEVMKQHMASKVKVRSFRLNSSYISLEHPVVQKGIELGLGHFGSPTLSDQALMNFPTLKIGPGDSARSHTADEFIYLKEIEKGIDIYIDLIKDLKI